MYHLAWYSIAMIENEVDILISDVVTLECVEGERWGVGARGLTQDWDLIES